MNLDDRKMCAEFAGWHAITEYHETLVGVFRARQGNAYIIPAYESDPAAACSLLPNLAGAMPIVDGEGVSTHYPFEELMTELASALGSDDAEVCHLIVEAVRGVKP